MGAQIATLPAMTAEGQMLFQWGETMGDARLSGELSTEVRISVGPSAKSAIPHAAVPAQITRQIAEHIPAAIGKPVQITLQPEELGRVRLSVAVSETGVIVSIFAERGETLDLMRRNIDQLQQDFFKHWGLGRLIFCFSQRVICLTQKVTQTKTLTQKDLSFCQTMVQLLLFRPRALI